MKSNIYKKMENLFNINIIDIAKKYNYTEENILILKNDIEKIKEKYPDLFNIINNCKHRKDSRPAVYFFQDLICSWIFEDAVIFNLKREGLNIKLNGCSERKILNDEKITAESDFIIEVLNKKFHIELVQDYTGFWKKEKKCDLRDNKINKIKKEESILIGIDMLDKKFFIISNIDIFNNGTMLNIHPIYKKPAYRLNLESVSFEKLTWKNLANKISSIIDTRIIN